MIPLKPVILGGKFHQNVPFQNLQMKGVYNVAKRPARNVHSQTPSTIRGRLVSYKIFIALSSLLI